jgi:peptidylprolyl isomerase
MPAPFSQGWVHNIRLFARAGWYDGISVNRVQDNYVTQWGDPNYDNPEATGKPKPLPEGLKVMGEKDYRVTANMGLINDPIVHGYEIWPGVRAREGRPLDGIVTPITAEMLAGTAEPSLPVPRDSYADGTGFFEGWPVAGERTLDKDKDRIQHFFPAFLKTMWPTHCYGMVGVGRNYSPDTGSGAELYTVIGHAPRHLDRNIALVGRVIEGMQHLSSLPRGKGDLGFYTAEEATKRWRVISRLPSNRSSNISRPKARPSLPMPVPSPTAAIRFSSPPQAAPTSATSRCRCGGWRSESAMTDVSHETSQRPHMDRGKMGSNRGLKGV